MEKTAQIETNFYSTGTGEGVLIWSGTSDNVNPKNPTKAIDTLAKLIALKLQQANISFNCRDKQNAYEPNTGRKHPILPITFRQRLAHNPLVFRPVLQHSGA